VEKEDLTVPLETIMEQANSESPNPGFFRNAYRQIKQRLEEKTYDGISDALAAGAINSIKVLAVTADIPLG